MNESLFHNSKLQNQLFKVYICTIKTHFLQFTNMRLLGNLMGSNTYFDVYKLGIENIFSQIGSLRDVWCVNMFSSYMISVNEEYAKDRC